MSRPSLEGIKQASVGALEKAKFMRQASAGALDKAKLMVGLKNNSEENGGEGDDSSSPSNNAKQQGSQQSRTSSFLDEAADLLCPELTFQQRLIGFGSCFTLGYLITFMSFKFFVELIEGYPVPFAMNYSFGNVLGLGASWFLCGPKRQFKNMFDEKRRLTSITFLSCLASTLVIVFIPLPWALKLFLLVGLLITQCLANFWYSLSYIPYGRRTVLNMVKRTLGLNNNERPSEGIQLA